MPSRALALVVFIVVGLAGCAQRGAEEAIAPAPAAASAGAPRMDWSPGTWWAYHAEVQGIPIDVTLVVSEATPTGFVLGTNLTSGFFGLPWSGNVTPERNPVLGAEVWPLFAPPLEDGKSWSYRLRGYDATTVARAAPQGGFQMEARSWGQTFARYDYAPDAGWFSHLELIEPTNGQVLLTATLVDYGDRFLDDFYVERTLRSITLDAPLLPGSASLVVPAGAVEVHATLTAVSDAGLVGARLVDSAGRVLAEARALGPGRETDTAATRHAGELRWTLEHTGAGLGRTTLEVTGVFPAR